MDLFRSKICPERFELVCDIFNRYLSGESTHEIANSFNEKEIPTKVGGRWKATGIRYILRNEKYIGDTLCQKTCHTNTLPFRQERNHGEVDQYYVEGSHNGIVEKAIFDKAREIINARKTKSFSEIYSLFSVVPSFATAGVSAISQV